MYNTSGVSGSLSGWGQGPSLSAHSHQEQASQNEAGMVADYERRRGVSGDTNWAKEERAGSPAPPQGDISLALQELRERTEAVAKMHMALLDRMEGRVLRPVGPSSNGNGAAQACSTCAVSAQIREVTNILEALQASIESAHSRLEI